MEVPPGRVERISDGGSDALRAILADLRTMKFNGILRTSVFRGDVPSQGLLVFRNGDGVLAEHRSAEAILGPDAVREILRDAASDKAQLEVRTYDYGHSSISLDHIQKSNGGAAIGGIGNVDRALGDVVAMCPPLVITAEEVDALAGTIIAAVRETEREIRAA